MIVRVEVDGQYFECEMTYGPVPGYGGNAWWLKSIAGRPRPTGKQVPRIYERALELAQRAMRRARGEL